MAVTMESALCDTHTQLQERVRLVSWRTVSVVYSGNTPCGLLFSPAGSGQEGPSEGRVSKVLPEV